MCPTSPPSDDLMSDPLLSAHKSIRESVRVLQHTTDPAAVTQALGELAAILPTHFAYEEREGGFIDRLSAENGGAAQQLRDEHEQLTALLAELQAQPTPDLALARRLANHVASHESLENRLAISPLSYEASSKKWRGYG